MAPKASEAAFFLGLRSSIEHQFFSLHLKDGGESEARDVNAEGGSKLDRLAYFVKAHPSQLHKLITIASKLT